MTWVLDLLATIPAPAVYALVGGLALAESVLFVGFVVPGEVAVVVGGVLAAQGSVSLTAMIAVAAAGAVAGDSLGFEIGRRFGPRLLAHAWVRRHQRAPDRAGRLMVRRGAWAVVVGRFTAYLRPIVPALAGAVGMRYRRFLVANAAGGIAWASACTLIGYTMGDAYRRALGLSHWASLSFVAAVAAAGVVVWYSKRRRRAVAPPPEGVRLGRSVSPGDPASGNGQLLDRFRRSRTAPG